MSGYLSRYVHHQEMRWTLGNAVICNADIKPLRIAFDHAFSHSDARVAQNIFLPLESVSNDSDIHPSLSSPKR